MPPSPWLSARITVARYLRQMTMTSAQNATDAAPKAVVTGHLEVGVVERLAERVDRAGADVAEHDAESAEREQRHTAGMSLVLTHPERRYPLIPLRNGDAQSLRSKNVRCERAT